MKTFIKNPTKLNHVSITEISPLKMHNCILEPVDKGLAYKSDLDLIKNKIKYTSKREFDNSAIMSFCIIDKEKFLTELKNIQHRLKKEYKITFFTDLQLKNLYNWEELPTRITKQQYANSIIV